jgi:LemA protein
MTALIAALTTLLTILVVLIVLVGIYVIITYNRLVQYRIDTENSWNQIDVQLKRRYDMIPNLVETVKSYLKHENETLIKVIEARNKAVVAKTPGEASAANGVLTNMLRELSVVIEQYPELKANQTVHMLYEELTSTENKIAFSRSHYNDVVANYTFLKQKFPTNMVASSFKFPDKEYFDIPEGDKEVPKIKF